MISSFATSVLRRVGLHHGRAKDNSTLLEEHVESIAGALFREELIDGLYVSLPVNSVDNGSKVLR